MPMKLQMKMRERERKKCNDSNKKKRKKPTMNLWYEVENAANLLACYFLELYATFSENNNKRTCE